MGVQPKHEMMGSLTTATKTPLQRETEGQKGGNTITKGSNSLLNIFTDSVQKIFPFPACPVVGLSFSEFLGVILQDLLVSL